MKVVQRILPAYNVNLFVIGREKLMHFALGLIIPFCGFTSHTILIVPPTLVLFFIGSLLLFSFNRKLYISNSLIIPAIAILYFSVTQTFIGAPLGRYMGVTFAICYYLVVVFFARQLTLQKLNSLVSKFITYSTLLLIIECIWRITHPQTEYAVFEESGDPRWIYQYKFGGLMYVDSNAVAIHIIIILFFIFYMEIERGEQRTKSKIALIILLVLTFSRAGWVGAFLGWIYIRFLRKQKFTFYLINFLFFSVTLSLFYKLYLQQKIESDLSFQSKLDIIKVVYKYISDASLSELLFGIGFSNSSERLGIYAHNFFMVFFIESGIFGLFIIVSMFVQLTVATNRKALFIIVPFLITTLSSSITFMPFLYVSLAIIFLLEKTEIQKIEVSAK
ncbi:O-antigen ligase family protein [Ohtaekwangia kribbensis]|uniref:O-antigen ligase family protein n=1 Tax=Ohtaekwangia kribbensis TaxID=688913 RepID=A0ABW3K3F7_9BACT